MPGRIFHSYAAAIAESGSGGATGVIGPNEWNNALSPFADVDAQTGTSYAISASTDLMALLTFSNSAAVAVSLAQASSTAMATGTAIGFYRGWFCWIENLGAGTVTVTPATSTIGGQTSLVLYSGEGAMIVSDGTNYAVFRDDTRVSFVKNQTSAFTTAQKQQACSNIGVTAIGQSAIGQISGTSGTTVPAAGCVGQRISSGYIAYNYAGSGVCGNVTSIFLAAGIYDIEAKGLTGGPGATTSSDWAMAISTASATISSGVVGIADHIRIDSGSPMADMSVVLYVMRQQIAVPSGGQTYYLNSQASYSGAGGYSFSGCIQATRMS